MLTYSPVVIFTLYAKEILDMIRGLPDAVKTSNIDKIYFTIKLLFGDIGFPETMADLGGESPPVGHDWLLWSLIIFHSIIIVITLLNLLIGILSSEFETFQETKLARDLSIQLSMIREADSIISIITRGEKKWVNYGEGLTQFEKGN